MPDVSATVRRTARAMTGLVVAGALLWSLGAGASTAAAQATPEAGQNGRILCQVTPLTTERLLGALDAATPQPLATLSRDALPAGEPVDQVTLEAVTATVTMALNCRNAGDFPRAYALFSDRMIGQLFGGRETVPPEIVQALSQPPQRVRPPFRVHLVEIADAVRLADGRVGAVVVTANATHTFEDFLIFVDEDGQWLIDETAVISAAPLAGTPVP